MQLVIRAAAKGTVLAEVHMAVCVCAACTCIQLSTSQ